MYRTLRVFYIRGFGNFCSDDEHSGCQSERNRHVSICVHDDVDDVSGGYGENWPVP